MRKTFLTLLAAGVALVACQKETELKPESLGEKVTITLTASNDNATKTTLSGTNATWAEGDKVTVMYKKTGESSWSTAQSSAAVTADAYATATFEASLTTPDGSENAYAIYPANNLSQTVADQAKITIAATQHPTSTSFDGASDIMISKPFTPSASPIATQFARANAVLKISIDNATLSTEKLVSLSVEGENDLAGDVLVGLSDHAVKGIENGSHTVTAEYATANQFKVSGNYVYLIVKPQTLASGSHLIINGVTRNYTFTKDITLTQNINLSAGHIMPLNINVTTATMAAKKDVLTYALTGLSGTSGSYVAWSGKQCSETGHSDAIYAGQSCEINASDKATYGEYIQLRATSPSGIITTTSGGAVSRIVVTYGGKANQDKRSLTVYGKNNAYSATSDLFDDETKGTAIGTIQFTTGALSGYLDIDGYYEYVGLLSGDGAMYFSEIEVYWGDAKESTGLVWKKSGSKETTDTATMLSGDDTMPTIALDNPNGLTVVYASSDSSVATIDDNTGEITLVGAGDTVISANYDGDATYRPDVQSYTLTVTDSRSTVATPSFSVAAGAVAENTSVRVKSDTPNATIYYKIGSAPTISSYDGVSTLKEDGTNKPYIDVTIDVAKTIYAIAVLDDYKDSSVGTAAYTIIGAAIPLSNPSTVSITAISRTGFTATWANDDNASGYSWMLSTSSTAPASTSDESVKAYGTSSDATLSAGAWTLTKSSLSLDGAYYFYVKAVGDGSVYSDSDYTRVQKVIITLNCSSNIFGLITSSGNDASTETSKTVNGFTYKLYASDACYYYGSKALFIGKGGSYITFPALSGVKLTSVSASNCAGASAKGSVSICPTGNTTPTTGGTASTISAGGSKTWTLTATSANTAYRIYINNGYNLQYTNITLIYSE